MALDLILHDGVRCCGWRDNDRFDLFLFRRFIFSTLFAPWSFPAVVRRGHFYQFPPSFLDTSPERAPGYGLLQPVDLESNPPLSPITFQTQPGAIVAGRRRLVAPDMASTAGRAAREAPVMPSPNSFARLRSRCCCSCCCCRCRCCCCRCYSWCAHNLRDLHRHNCSDSDHGRHRGKKEAADSPRDLNISRPRRSRTSLLKDSSA